MNCLWKIVRTMMAIVGGLLIFGAVGTSDYYVLELGQHEPASVWSTIIVGFVLITPMLIHVICEELKERANETDEDCL